MDNTDEIIIVKPLVSKRANGADKGNESQSKQNGLLYRIDHNPPWLLSIILGFQHYLTMFGATVGLPFALSEPLCLANNVTVIGELISTLFFCSGLVTLLQTSFGVRLPIIQGGTYTFLAPTVAIMETRTTTCFTTVISSKNATATIENTEERLSRMREIQGAIMMASLFQIFIGFSGVMGFILKFLGPLTICPTIACGCQQTS